MKLLVGPKPIALFLVGTTSLVACWQAYQYREYAANMPPKTSVDPKEVLAVSTDIRGASIPKYVLVEFGDYQCPPCAHAAPTVLALLKKYPSDLGFVFRNMPLSIHPLSRQAASIAMACRYDHWRVHDELYSYGAKLSPEILKRIQDAHKIKPADMKLAEENVALDESVSKDFNANSTPSFFLLSCAGSKAQVFGPASLDQVDWVVNHHAS